MARATIRIDPEKLRYEPLDTGRSPDPCALVIFGGTGDLSRRKLIPALYNLSKDQALPDGVAVVGLSLEERSADAFRELHRESTARFSRTKPLDEAAWGSFAQRLEFVSGDLADDATYHRLRERLEETDRRLGTKGNRLFYFAVPASVFPVILNGLSRTGLVRQEDAATVRPWSRVIIEKPFGRDLTTARELNKLCATTLDESQVFRIDHYLGKETVKNILVFRFGNAIFEPLWNRKYVDHVQVTAAEEIGIEGRGKFYDETGVVRDIVQNHLLQVLALCAMEPPVSFEADEIRDEKAQVFRSLHKFMLPKEVERSVVLGQYRGYREEPHVANDSRTPTFAAIKLFIDNWRWQGVPFYLRAGKRLKKRVTEVSIFFQSIPLLLFRQHGVEQAVEPNVLTMRIQPDEGITLRFVCKVPGDQLSVSPVAMDFSYAKGFHKPVPEAYEHLLLDCLRGDATLFWRRDEVSRAWDFVMPILGMQSECPLSSYEPGSTGPAEADELLAHDGRKWRPIE